MRTLLLLPVVCLIGCATQPKTYQPPDATRLKTSTARVATAVNNAHQNARKAQAAVKTAQERVQEVQLETHKIKDLPVTLVQKVNDLENQLVQAQSAQTELEKNLQEADQAKAQVEKDKTDYFAKAQGLADAATTERNDRIKAEKSLSWYRWHWWGAWLIAGAGIVLLVIIAILKFTGKLAIGSLKL